MDGSSLDRKKYFSKRRSVRGTSKRRASPSRARRDPPPAVDAMPSREGVASSDAQSRACPPLCTPLEGLRAWQDRPPPSSASSSRAFAYAFLEDSTRRERARLDARALAHRVALARDGLLELLREKDVRASPWTEDLDLARQRPGGHPSVRAAEVLERVSPHRRRDEERKTKRKKEVRSEDDAGVCGQVAVVLVFPPLDGLDFLVAFLACQACSVVAVPARAPDPTAHSSRFAEERAALFNVAAACGARVALTSESYAAAFKLASFKLASLDSVSRAFRFVVTKTRSQESSASREEDVPLAFVPLERVSARGARERREKTRDEKNDDDVSRIVSRSG